MNLIQCFVFPTKLYIATKLLTQIRIAHNMSSSSPLLQRFPQVEGHQNRHNDVIYHPISSTHGQNGSVYHPLSSTEEGGRCSVYHPLSSTQEQHGSVIYFGGDVQDLPEVQATHRDNSRYMEWNLEATAVLLAKNFPGKHIMVVRPARTELRTLSCFDNFVKSDAVGAPSHSKTHGALQHLQQLIFNVANKVNMAREDLLPVTLIGFSKGVVVLNQILYELSDKKNCDLLAIFEMCWLDGGHNGGKETWITDKNLLNSFATSGIKVKVRVTPYQVRDTRRPWIRKEEKIFSQTLTRLGADIERKMYFEEEEACIENHFRILTTLKDQ